MEQSGGKALELLLPVLKDVRAKSTEGKTEEEKARGHAEEQWTDAETSGVCQGQEEDADANRDHQGEQLGLATQGGTQTHDAQQDLQLRTLYERRRTSGRRETKNLLKERNEVRLRPRSTARDSGDSTNTSRGSTSTSSSSNSSTSSSCRSTLSSSSSRVTPGPGSSSTLSTSTSETRGTSSLGSNRTSSTRSTPSSSSSPPAPGKPLTQLQRRERLAARRT
ncbi:unnamed protein product, partial [Closterium sp. NIES-53]